MSNRKLTASQLRKFRHDISTLKAKGLVSKRVTPRSQKPTRHMLAQVKLYDDVLKGKAQVVKLPKRAQAKEFSERFRTKGKSVVVPTKDARLTYSEKTHQIKAHGVRNGRKTVVLFDTKPVGNARDLPTGPHIKYQIIHGGTWIFDDPDGLEDFMRSAENSGWKDWAKYVQILQAA